MKTKEPNNVIDAKELRDALTRLIESNGDGVKIVLGTDDDFTDGCHEQGVSVSAYKDCRKIETLMAAVAYNLDYDTIRMDGI